MTVEATPQAAAAAPQGGATPSPSPAGDAGQGGAGGAAKPVLSRAEAREAKRELAAARTRELRPKMAGAKKVPAAEPPPDEASSAAAGADGAAGATDAGDDAGGAPGGEPAVPERDGDGKPLKPSIKAQMRRYAKQAQREKLETLELKREIARERQALEAERAREKAELDKDWLGATAKKRGLSREQLVAELADDKANELPPALQARFQQIEDNLAADRKAREDREKALADRERKLAQGRAFERDVEIIVTKLGPEKAEEFPFFAALKDKTKVKRTHAAVRAAIQLEREAEAAGLTDDPEYKPITRLDIVEMLDDEAREDAEDFHGNERVRSRLGVKNAPAAPAGKSPPAPARRQPPVPTARAAAEPTPPPRRPTAEERRERGAQRTRELQGRMRPAK